MKKFLRVAVATVMTAVLLVSQASAFNYWDNGYILAADGESRMAMPKPYTCEQVVEKLEGPRKTTFSNPQDLFLAPSGEYYVADTGNKRIVKLTNDFKFIAEFDADGELNSPEGIYVTDKGDMFIADSGNERVIHLSPTGVYIEEFVMPKSELLHNVTTFSPSKVAINPVNNYLYVVQGKQFMSIDAVNNFKGYIGANKVGFDLINLIFMTFATDEQKDQKKVKEPEAYFNFCVANGGKIYATGAEKKKRISVINTVGENIFPEQEYGETLYDNRGVKRTPVFVDICADENEIITVIEQNTCCLYQYDYEGNLLCIFGGEGSTDGYFSMPSSIVYGGDGKLVTLDAALARIQVFEPTDFIKTVQSAVIDYSNGEYDASYDKWLKIKENNASYSLAREFIGKIQLKRGNYEESLDDFIMSEDRLNYGKAFEKIRYGFMQNYFYYIVAAAVVILVVLILLFKQLNKYVKKIKKEFWDKLEG